MQPQLSKQFSEDLSEMEESPKEVEEISVLRDLHMMGEKGGVGGRVKLPGNIAGEGVVNWYNLGQDRGYSGDETKN